MIAASSLRGHLALSLIGLAIGISTMTLTGASVFYGLLLYQTQGVPPSLTEWLPDKFELVWAIAATVVSVFIAVVSAVRLAQKFLIPLGSVAANLRVVAQGDLSARAVDGLGSPLEISQLVQDFNSMAETLQRMANQRAVWNATIAHELRTPVTILQGRLQALNDGVFSASPQEFRRLLSHVEGLTQLIEDLRSVALAESSQLALGMRCVEASREISLVLESYQPRLASAGLTLETQLTEQVVECDPIRLRQVVIALLENAVQHAAPGNVRVSTVVEEGRLYRVRVEDNGPGVSEELATDIFEAFYRCTRTGASPTGGSGLGLAVVRAIVLAHGGTVICVPSSLGGAAFDLRFPLLAHESAAT
ncbi:ATP-binding protein [Bordetella sp. N]|uniref:ATP-binding protein n=1 Tax=Bordetella sp. N TaxID=1746199 RepID=UPI0007096462|nr:ATP-binding protein [Bordetella sp. N]ALM85206.1 hypothetical protein ASB57_21475 [Bordetella sp. N]